MPEHEGPFSPWFSIVQSRASVGFSDRKGESRSPQRRVAGGDQLSMSAYPWVVAWMFPCLQNQVRVQIRATGTGMVP